MNKQMHKYTINYTIHDTFTLSRYADITYKYAYTPAIFMQNATSSQIFGSSA